MSNNGNNGHNGNGHGGGGHSGDDRDESLSTAQMELLRQALKEQGKRLGELESKMDATMDEFMLIREIIERTHERMRKIASRLGIDPEDI